jgi:hypothetical protein
MTLAELRERMARRASDAAAMHATAPVADVLGMVLAELEAFEVADPPRPSRRTGYSVCTRPRRCSACSRAGSTTAPVRSRLRGSSASGRYASPRRGCDAGSSAARPADGASLGRERPADLPRRWSRCRCRRCGPNYCACNQQETARPAAPAAGALQKLHVHIDQGIAAGPGHVL